MRKKWKPRIEVLSSKEHGCSIQKWAGVQLRNSKFRIAATHGAFQRAKEAGGIDEMMDPSISPRFVIGRVNRSLLRPPNSPFLSAFFVSKAQIPPSKAARFGLVYSFIRGLMRVRNLELSIKSAAFYTGNWQQVPEISDFHCECIAHGPAFFCQLDCLLIWPGKKGPNTGVFRWSFC